MMSLLKEFNPPCSCSIVWIILSELEMSNFHCNISTYLSSKLIEVSQWFINKILKRNKKKVVESVKKVVFFFKATKLCLFISKRNYFCIVIVPISGGEISGGVMNGSSSKTSRNRNNRRNGKRRKSQKKKRQRKNKKRNRGRPSNDGPTGKRGKNCLWYEICIWSTCIMF